MTDSSLARHHILGFDVGSARLGLARSTALGTAEPLEVLRVKNRPWRETLERIEQICRLYEISEFVVGLPRNMDGTIGPQAKSSQLFARKLAQAFPATPVFFEDERLTTEAAFERLNEMGVRGPKAREKIDAIAACLIVEARLARLADTASEQPPLP